MMKNLTGSELVALVKRVFEPGDDDKKLAILVDLPDEKAPDTEAWRFRRETAAKWADMLEERQGELGLDTSLVYYRNAHTNNGDLPETAVLHRGEGHPATAAEPAGEPVRFEHLFETHQILIAPTQFSATAPLKMAAKKWAFRAATMPGFSAAMIPALRLDYSVIGARVDRLKAVLDDAVGCDIAFRAEGKDHRVHLDLRHRTAHASGGVFPKPGVAGNLPSGEAYIVPYEGEVDGDPSRTAGEIPVQFGDDVVVYRIENNKAVEVISDNPASRVEGDKLAKEPAYGNLAELGLGVLGDFGLEPTGEILLDEKLGLHIAFGRSEHFGGQVGPSDFSSPEQVIHIDRVYIPKLQPAVEVVEADIILTDGRRTPLMRAGRYVISLD